MNAMPAATHWVHRIPVRPAPTTWSSIHPRAGRQGVRAAAMLRRVPVLVLALFAAALILQIAQLVTVAHAPIEAMMPASSPATTVPSGCTTGTACQPVHAAAPFSAGSGSTAPCAMLCTSGHTSTAADTSVSWVLNL